jgi:hypothetical protein
MGNLMTAPYTRSAVSSWTSFQAVKVEVGSRNFHPATFRLGVVASPTKMLIGHEGAHVFWMSIFGEVEHLRGPTCRSPKFPAESAQLQSD